MTPSGAWPPREDPAAPPDLVELGRIGAAFGVRGWVKIHPYGNPLDSSLLQVEQTWIGRPGTWAPVRILEIRPQNDVLAVHFDGCQDRDAAAALKGLDVAIPRADFPPADSHEYYWVDLIGCEVVDLQARVLGRVSAVEDFGAPHPVLKVADADHDERIHLIPFVAPIVGEVDLQHKRIEVDWAPDF